MASYWPTATCGGEVAVCPRKPTVGEWATYLKGIIAGVIMCTASILCYRIYKWFIKADDDLDPLLIDEVDDYRTAIRLVRRRRNQEDSKEVRDVCTMSQTSYVKNRRHDSVNNYHGDVFTGTPYTLTNVREAAFLGQPWVHTETSPRTQ